MADNTKIEWTEATWNPITGCSVHSAGCTNCYAMKLAGTRLRNHPSRAGLTIETKAGPVWNGQVRFNEDWLDQPLRWKRPRMIFVCAHADLFHEAVPDEWIDRIFAVMALCPQHTFQVLTKRSDRMREWFDRYDAAHDHNCADMVADAVAVQRGHPGARGGERAPGMKWPLPNVWLGVSVENQAAADERIPDLLATPAAIRWISAEPLLGPVNLHAVRNGAGLTSPLAGYIPLSSTDHKSVSIDWVVVGGESGDGSRPMHPDWARSLRHQCAAAGRAFFFKQWGDWKPMISMTMTDFDRQPRRGSFNDGTNVIKVGKKHAGRLLDGRQHDAMPTLP